MTDDELRRLAGEATPGPWSDVSIGEDYGCVAGGPSIDGMPESGSQVAMGIAPADAAYIAAAANALPGLLDRIDYAMQSNAHDDGAVELAAFLERNEGRWALEHERSLNAPVIAIIELRETRRKWFVVGAELHEGRRVLIGFEPRCRYHAPGDGWFALASEFFVRAARATGDQLDVHTLSSAVSVAELDIDDAC